MSKIKDILTKKGPHFNIVTPETKVLDALTLMKAENLSYVVVMKDDQYVGLMSERDYTHKIKLEGRKSETATVKDIMTTNYPVIAYTDDLERCMVLMNVYKTRYLPVFDEILMYNCLQHTENPAKICHNILAFSKIVRVFEWVDTGIADGHIQDLTEASLNGWLKGEGKVEFINQSPVVGKAYYGVFKGNHYEKV